jgi:hypothetical protein
MARLEGQSSFGERMWRAAKLEASLYDEVYADKEATGQALAVVVLQSLAGAILVKAGFGAFLFRVILGLVLWYLGAVLIYWLGTKVFPESQIEADFEGILRAYGFAGAPGLIMFLAILPSLKGLVIFIAFFWVLFADLIAIRQALNYRSTWRAFGVLVILYIVVAFVGFYLSSWLGFSEEPI